VSGRSSRPGGRLAVGLREAPEEVRPAGARLVRLPSDGRPPRDFSPGLPDRARSEGGRSLRDRSDDVLSPALSDRPFSYRGVSPGFPPRGFSPGFPEVRGLSPGFPPRGFSPGFPPRGFSPGFPGARGLSPGFPDRGFPPPAELGRPLPAGVRPLDPVRLCLLGRSDVTVDPLRQVLGK
jgi:hypothetical protein